MNENNDLKFGCSAEFNGKSFDLELELAKPESAGLFEPGKVRGHKCVSAAADGTALNRPDYVSCYTRTFQDVNPAVTLKFEAADSLRSELGIDGKGNITIRIPEEKRQEFLDLIGSLEQGDRDRYEELQKEREERDLNIADDEIVTVSFTPLYVIIRYPFDSIRDKEESKIWTRYREKPELGVWIEENMKPWLEGLGCGQARKYLIPYGDYKRLLGEWEEKLAEM